MPEAQYTISGFNIAGLDPIEVSKPVTGTTLTFTDSDIGKMNVFSGSANTTVALPSASGTLDGYDKAGRMIGLRGAASMTAKITTSGLTPARSLLNNHRLILISNGTSWEIHQHYWPPMVGYFSAFRSGNDTTDVGDQPLVYNATADTAGNADGWYNFTTGVYSPLLPGYYAFELMASITANPAGVMLLYQGKNGASSYLVDRRSIAAAANETLGSGIVLPANGTTDSFQPRLNGTVAGIHASHAGCVWQATYKGPL